MIAVAVLAVSIILTPAPEPPPLPEGFVCEPGTVPGWLNEDGLPTSCVGDQANPGEEPIFTAEPAPVEPEPEAVEPLPEPLPLEPLPLAAQPSTPVDQLAETGPADLTPLAAAGGLLVLLGGLLTRIGRRSA